MPYPYTYPITYEFAVESFDDTVAEIRYELDDREIYNDVRSDITTVSTETVTDADPLYEWKKFGMWGVVGPDGNEWIFRLDTGILDSVTFKVTDTTARAGDTGLDRHAYYDFRVRILDTDAPAGVIWCGVTNTGSESAYIQWKVGYKYLVAEAITHDEAIPALLTVRATDQDSIQKYGRRVMNLTWAEGTPESAMQTLVDYYIERYAEPVARLICLIKGTTDALMTQIITREISDLIYITCTNLGLAANCFINSITISDDPTGIPICTWGLEINRTYELLQIFTIDSSKIDGPHIIGA